MCHTQGQGDQCSSEKTIHLEGKAREASHGHINGTLLEGATL